MRYAANWLPELDVLRATAILFLQFYFIGVVFVNSQNTDTYYFYWLGQFGLAMFFFVSGYAIDRNNRKMRTRNDVAKFLKKRAKRIYPFYWLALGLLYLAPLLYSMAVSGKLAAPSPTSIAIAGTYLVGAQELFSSLLPNKYIWFVSAILILYVVYIAIARYSPDSAATHNLRNLLAVSTVIFVAFIAWSYLYSPIEDRFFLYYYVFISGIFVSRTNVFDVKVRSPLLFFVLFSVVVITVAYQILLASHLHADIQANSLIGTVARDLIYFATDLLLIFLIYQLAHNYYTLLDARIHSVVGYVAYAAFCMYLFGTAFLGPAVTTFILRQNAPTLLTVALQVFVLLPLLIIFSYNLQRAADRLVRRSQTRPETMEAGPIQIESVE